MVGTCGKVLFLTGAPLPNTLVWEEEDLSATLQPCFAEDYKRPSKPIPNSEDVWPSWRSLPLQQPHLPTGLTQASREGRSFGNQEDAGNETSFLSASKLSFVSGSPVADHTPALLASESDREDDLSRYYEHSFALHEDIPSSQIIGPASADKNASFITEPEEFSIAYTANSDLETDEQLARSRLTSGRLSNLEDMPNAAYLHSITPQTMTVNLVVGIISISQPRTIKTRRGERSVELVEMLVGDDTRAGFGINIWLPPSQVGNHSRPWEDTLRNDTLQLRPRDIVLVKQVALSSFRGKVYCQSLRRGMTTLDLLYRNVVDREDRRGAFRAKDLEEGAVDDLQFLKVKRVKHWVTQFVGASANLPGVDNRSKAQLRKSIQLEALPNDTP